MSLRLGWMVALPILAAMLAASFYVLGELPPGARIATHFGLDGQPNDWSSAWFGVLVMPVTGLFMSLIFSVLPIIDPRRHGIERSMLALVAIWLAALVVLAAGHAAILLKALGQPVEVGRLLTGAAGLLLLVMGNFQGKIRWNYTFGIRTPWTLASERVWDKTHRFGGWLFFALGAVLIGAALLSIDAMTRGRIFYLIVPVGLLIVLKSYLLWRQEQHQP